MCARSKDMSGKYFRNLVTNLTIKEEKIIGAIFQAVKMVHEHVFSKGRVRIIKMEI